MLRVLALALALVSGCASPLQIHRQDLVLGEVAAHYRSFYPDEHDPDPSRDAGLLRPRFGLPAIARAGDDFAVELLERGEPEPPRAALVLASVDDAAAERCLAGETIAGCYVAALTPVGRQPLAGATRARLRARTLAPAGRYDLYLHSRADAPTRAPSAVFLRADDPRTLDELRVVQLSDLHVGKHCAGIDENLARVVRETNALHPDLVIVTGDVVNQGRDAALFVRAEKALLAIEAPVAMVLGNHDIGFRSLVGRRYGRGWENFGRTFHPFLEYELDLGGYRFIGFDSGPSTLSPRILTRGLSPSTIAYLENALGEAARDHVRGVVLFSHAPSRAILGSTTPSSGGAFGHMEKGHAELERIMRAAADQGLRIYHLAGHTHWSDVFELRERSFQRWPDGAAVDEPRTIEGNAALITTQAATHAGPLVKASAHGYGFTLLLLGDGPARLRFFRHL